MLNPPQTLDEARARRYSKWPGAPNGYAYNEGKCAYEHLDSAGWQAQQCTRRNGKGVNGLYCGIHAKIAQREIDSIKEFDKSKTKDKYKSTWVIYGVNGFYPGTWNSRTDAIYSHCKSTGESWPQRKAKGDHAMKVEIREVKP